MINAIINGGEQSQYQLLQSEWMDRAKWSLAASAVYKRYSSIDEKRSVRSIKAVFASLDTFVISGINHT